MALRVDFDPANRILLLHFDGQLSDESVAEFYRAIRKHWIAADARMGIVDFSAVTAFALSSELIRQLAEQEPCMPDPASRPRVIVAPTNLEFGLARMFQILGESARPLLSVVHTLDEALAALGIPFAHFEPLESE
jgi:hypothetical protein